MDISDIVQPELPNKAESFFISESGQQMPMKVAKASTDGFNGEKANQTQFFIQSKNDTVPGFQRNTAINMSAATEDFTITHYNDKVVTGPQLGRFNLPVHLLPSVPTFKKRRRAGHGPVMQYGQYGQNGGNQGAYGGQQDSYG